MEVRPGGRHRSRDSPQLAGDRLPADVLACRRVLPARHPGLDGGPVLAAGNGDGRPLLRVGPCARAVTRHRRPPARAEGRQHHALHLRWGHHHRDRVGQPSRRGPHRPRRPVHEPRHRWSAAGHRRAHLAFRAAGAPRLARRHQRGAGRVQPRPGLPDGRRPRPARHPVAPPVAIGCWRPDRRRWVAA